jgi:Putative prokaryotic signal transducing protein
MAETRPPFGAISEQTIRTTRKQGQGAGLSRHGGISVYTSAMRAVLKSNNPVVLSYATHILEESGITALVFDTHASIMDGSMAMVPRRLMVADDDYTRAEKLLRDAVPDAMP